MAKLYLGSREITPAIINISKKYGCSVDNLLGDVNSSGVLQMPANTSGDIVFTGVKDVTDYALYYKFVYNSNITGSVSFPDLEGISGNFGAHYAFANAGVSSVLMPKLKTVSGSNAAQVMFANTNITSISLPELTTISGASGCRQMFQNCPNLETVSLPKLQEISGSYGAFYMFFYTKVSTLSFPMLSVLTGSSCCGSMFQNCSDLESLSFPALTTTSFGSYTNQFGNMLGGTGKSKTHTIHFPSNLESTIQGLTGYPLFGGTSGYVTLSFDLPATS